MQSICVVVIFFLSVRVRVRVRVLTTTIKNFEESKTYLFVKPVS